MPDDTTTKTVPGGPNNEPDVGGRSVYSSFALRLGAPSLLVWSKLSDIAQQSEQQQWFWKLCQPGYSDEDRREAFAELVRSGKYRMAKRANSAT